MLQPEKSETETNYANAENSEQPPKYAESENKESRFDLRFDKKYAFTITGILNLLLIVKRINNFRRFFFNI